MKSLKIEWRDAFYVLDHNDDDENLIFGYMPRVFPSVSELITFILLSYHLPPDGTPWFLVDQLSDSNKIPSFLK